MLVIADFDSYFYNIRIKDSINDIITEERYSKILTWETTTSIDAAAKIPANELVQENILIKEEKNERPQYIHIAFSDRTLVNKLYYLLYKVLQLIYTSFYYYFMPFVATFVVAFVLNYENERISQDSK